MRRLSVILALITLFYANSSAQRLALNTDVAMDALGAPSLGIELTMAKRSTFNINAMYGSNFLWGQNKVLAVQPEWRYYISGRPMYAWYIGAVGIFTTYDLTFREKKYDGQAYGAGLSFGYVFPLTKRLSISVHSSAGMVYYKQKEYFLGDDYESQYTNTDGYVIPNAKGTFFMPIRAGVSLSYLLK